jgi:hypothetical protein
MAPEAMTMRKMQFRRTDPFKRAHIRQVCYWPVMVRPDSQSNMYPPRSTHHYNPLSYLSPSQHFLRQTLLPRLCLTVFRSYHSSLCLRP